MTPTRYYGMDAPRSTGPHPDPMEELLTLMSKWRPIDSAPRDGSRFLATGGGLADVVEIVSYNERVGAWDAMTCTLDDRDDEPQGYSRPTHWMPLSSIRETANEL